MCTYMYMLTCIHILADMYAHTGIQYTSTCMCIQTYNTQAYIHARMHTHTHTHTHTPIRRSFVFSEWAASNKQTFVFEGAHSLSGGDEDSGSLSFRRIAPCKFVSVCVCVCVCVFCVYPVCILCVYVCVCLCVCVCVYCVCVFA